MFVYNFKEFSMESKRLTIIAASTVAAATLAFSAFAVLAKKFKGTQPDIAPDKVKRLTKKLGLSDEQVEKVQTSFDAHVSDMEKIHVKYKDNLKDRKSKIHELEAAFDKEVSELLTPSQNMKFVKKPKKTDMHKVKSLQHV